MSANAWDASGATAFGLRVAWINRFAQRPERLPFQLDVEIKTLAELPGRLKLSRRCSGGLELSFDILLLYYQ